MKKWISAGVCLFASCAATAGDFRGIAGYGIGAVNIESDSGDEIDADSSQLVFDGLYFLGEAGPFFGFRYSQAEVDDFEVNGASVDVPELEVDTTSFAVGYRSGSRGEPQLIASVRLSRSDSDDGDDSDSTIFTIGVEKDVGSGRYAFTGSYDREDDFDSFGVDATGFIYVSELLGLTATAGYSFGDGTFLGEDADTTGWVLGVGVELRVFQ